MKIKSPFMRTIVGDIPIWAVTKLGCDVKLIKPYDAYDDGSYVFSAGEVGQLQGLEKHGKGARALVFLRGELGTMWDVPFDALEPVF